MANITVSAVAHNENIVRSDGTPLPKLYKVAFEIEVVGVENARELVRHFEELSDYTGVFNAVQNSKSETGNNNFEA